MNKYINPYTDFGFKRLFGTEGNKDLLVDFLNCLMPAKHQITDLSFRNFEQLGEIPTDRKSIYENIWRLIQIYNNKVKMF